MEADKLFRMDFSSRSRVLAESEGSIGLRGVVEGLLKRRLLRTRVLECEAGEGLRIGVPG